MKYFLKITDTLYYKKKSKTQVKISKTQVKISKI